MTVVMAHCASRVVPNSSGIFYQSLGICSSHCAEAQQLELLPVEVAMLCVVDFVGREWRRSDVMSDYGMNVRQS